MNFSKVVLSIAAIGLFGIAIAEDQSRVKIEVISDDDSHDVIRFELDSDDMGFNLHDMQEGENRSVVDKSGRSILVTRTAEGFSFNVDGKTIDMPMMSRHHGVVIAGDGVHHGNVDIRVMRHGDMSAPMGLGGTMIHTAKPVDEVTQQAITSLLESAGHSGDVHFIDRDSMHEVYKQVRVIEERVEISE